MIKYANTGNKKYLDKWSEITDDWAMHYTEQVGASPKNERKSN